VFTKPVNEIGEEMSNAIKVLLTDSRYLIAEMNRTFSLLIYCFDLLMYYFDIVVYI
jgi:hypothetical protein